MCWPSKAALVAELISPPLFLSLSICKYSSVSIEYWVLGTRQSSHPSPSPTPLLVVISKIACINALNVNEWVTSRGELLLMMLRHLQQLFGFPFNPPSLSPSPPAAGRVKCYLARCLFYLAAALKYAHVRRRRRTFRPRFVASSGLLQHKSRPSMQHKKEQQNGERERKNKMAQRQLN